MGTAQAKYQVYGFGFFMYSTQFDLDVENQTLQS